jgi:hypothetical protein
MIASMFSLDHRLAELRPSDEEQRVARQLREAAAPATRPARSVVEPTRKWATANVVASHLTRLVAI